MVCPNRLFALDTTDPTDIRDWSSLSEPVRYVLEALGASPRVAGAPMGAWSEITVSERRGRRSFNYRFDFLLNPVEEMTPERSAARLHARVQAKTPRRLGGKDPHSAFNG